MNKAVFDFKIRIAVTVSVFVYAINLNAANVSHFVGLNFTHYKNVNLVNDPAADEVSESIIGGLSIIDNTSDLVLNVNARVNAINFKKNQAPDRSTGELLANALWIIKPRQFEWFVSDTFRQTAIDSLLSNSISNQQNANAFSTGPNYFIRVNPRSNIAIEGRIENYAFENFIDNNRYSIASRWLYDVNRALNMNANYEFEMVDYQGVSSDLNYDRSDVFIGLQYQRGLNTLEAEVGATQISNNLLNDVNSARYLLSIQNERTRTSNIRLVYENILSDTSNQLLGSSNLSINNNSSLPITSSDTFVNESVRFEYNKTTTYGSFLLSMRNRKYDYTNLTNLNQKVSSIGLVNTWNLKQGSHLSIRGDARRTLFEDSSLNREDKDYLYQATYTYSARRNISLIFDAISQKRESTVLISSYDDVRLLLTLEYVSR